MIDAKVRPGGRIVWSRITTANSSNRTLITVAAGKIVRPLYITCALVTTATVGNRFLELRITDGTNPVWCGEQSAAIAASKIANGVWSCMENTVSTTNTRRTIIPSAPDVSVKGPLPEIYLPEGYVINVWDTAVIDANADDMTSAICYIEYDT